MTLGDGPQSAAIETELCPVWWHSLRTETFRRPQIYSQAALPHIVYGPRVALECDAIRPRYDLRLI